MRLKPRSSFHLHALILLPLALAVTSTLAFSQQRGRGKPSPVTQNQNAERARRAQAIQLLAGVADKARQFDDLFYRARIQALAADALWPADAQQARAIFRRAWEAAAEESGALPSSIAKTSEARDEVLRLAARRDARLADIFLRELSGERDESNAQRHDAEQRRTAWRELSASGARRLALAYEMLQAGEARRAAELAAPLINEGASADTIAFILQLHDASNEDGEALYSRLLERAAAAANAQTDANAILLLSAPIISPGLLVAVDEFGSLQFRAVPRARANDNSRQPFSMRAQALFFNLAASVLSQPASVTRDGALVMQELMSRFYATGRLLPFFENSSASYAAFAPTLRLRQSELFNQIEANRRDQFSSQFSVSSLTQTATTDPLRLPAEEFARTTDSMERERLALAMVRTATRNRSWDRARRAAAELENAELRKAALSFIQIHQIKDIADAYSDEKEDDFEGIVKFVRGADVPPFGKAWGLAQAAQIASRKHTPQISQTIAQLFDEAESYASRVTQGRPERVAAYGTILLTAARLDAPRAWNLLRELVKSANAVEDFTGDQVALSLATDENSTAEATEQFSIEAEVFRLDRIFATMAQLDFDKALAEARALDGDVPQAFALIAVAKSRIRESESRPQKR